MKYFISIGFFWCWCVLGHAQKADHVITSPDKNINVSVDIAQSSYTISYKGVLILRNSKLGLVRADEDFSHNLKLLKISAPVLINENYTIRTAKKSSITYQAIERIIETKTKSGKKMN